MLGPAGDTIAAIATPPGEGGVGIVRISGQRAFEIADTLFHTPSGAPSSVPSHTIHYGLIRDPASGEPVDDALLLPFRAPHSYTGEDVVELSCHGGPIVLSRVLRLALAAGARLAEPGEFTQRAFLNGRMDLAQAEAVCDLIRAKTEAAQRLAALQREGALSREVARLRDELVGALAAVEVTIDFSDDVGDLDYEALSQQLATIRRDIERLAATAQQGRIYREGVRLAIAGRPNVGKSSLLNSLLREERAIVTSIAGTTRDTIEEAANIRGIPITAIDTAGLRATDDPVEQIGVQRARAALESAALILHVVDLSAGWTPEDRAIAAELPPDRTLTVLNKRDIASPPPDAAALAVSAVTGEGMAALEDRIAQRLQGSPLQADAVVVTNVRHQQALEAARASLVEAESTTAQRLPPDFISIDLRGALDALGQVTGHTVTEEIIHRIFHDFCVGK